MKGTSLNNRNVDLAVCSVSGVGCRVSAPPLAAEVASLIEKETLKKRISNNECRMSNVEVRYSVYF